MMERERRRKEERKGNRRWEAVVEKKIYVNGRRGRKGK